MTEIHGMVPTAVAFFQQNNKNYPQTLTLLGMGFLALLRTGGGWILPPSPSPTVIFSKAEQDIKLKFGRNIIYT